MPHHFGILIILSIFLDKPFTEAEIHLIRRTHTRLTCDDDIPILGFPPVG